MGTSEIIVTVFGCIVVLFVIFCAIINEVLDYRERKRSQAMLETIREEVDNAERMWNAWDEFHKRKSRWVNVDDRLPTPDEYDWVLVNVKFDEDGTYGVPHIAEYRNGEWWGYFDDVTLKELGETVTHWMPLPEYPERDEIV